MSDLLTNKFLLVPQLSIFFLYGVYILWARVRIETRLADNFFRIDEFEYSLLLETDDYSCYSNRDGGLWSPADYSNLRNEILDSPGFKYTFLVPIHDPGLRFSFAVNEDEQTIYVALGKDAYDWDSLKSPLRLARRGFTLH